MKHYVLLLLGLFLIASINSQEATAIKQFKIEFDHGDLKDFTIPVYSGERVVGFASGNRLDQQRINKFKYLGALVKLDTDVQYIQPGYNNQKRIKAATDVNINDPNFTKALALFLSTEGFQKYFGNSNPNNNVKWGGYQADEFEQRKRFEMFKASGLMEKLKRAYNTAPKNELKIISIKLQGYDFEAKRYLIPIYNFGKAYGAMYFNYALNEDKAQAFSRSLNRSMLYGVVLKNGVLDTFRFFSDPQLNNQLVEVPITDMVHKVRSNLASGVNAFGKLRVIYEPFVVPSISDKKFEVYKQDYYNKCEQENNVKYRDKVKIDCVCSFEKHIEALKKVVPPVGVVLGQNRNFLEKAIKENKPVAVSVGKVVYADNTANQLLSYNNAKELLDELERGESSEYFVTKQPFCNADYLCLDSESLNEKLAYFSNLYYKLYNENGGLRSENEFKQLYLQKLNEKIMADICKSYYSMADYGSSAYSAILLIEE